MSLNPDPSKRAQEVIFCRKVNMESHTLLVSDNNLVYQPTSQKHQGIMVDNYLLLEDHLRVLFSKINETIGLLRKISMPHPKIRTSYYILSFCQTKS